MARTIEAYKKLKVPELKDLLRESNLALTGKKDDLIQRLLEHDAAQAEPVVVEKEMEVEPEVEPDLEAEPEPVVEVEVESMQSEEVIAEVAEIPTEIASNNIHSREEEVLEVEDARPTKRIKVAEVVEEQIEAPVDELKIEPEELPVAVVVEEEEEPPVYDFAPEVVDLSSSDMYLDTVRELSEFDFILSLIAVA